MTVSVGRKLNYAFFLIFMFSYVYNLETRWEVPASLVALLFLVLAFLRPAARKWKELIYYVVFVLLKTAPLFAVSLYAFVATTVYQGDAYILGASLLKTFLFAALFAFFAYSFLVVGGRSASEKISGGDLINCFVAVAFIQSIFIFISFISTDFVNFVNHYLVVKGNLTGEEGFRVKGFANSGGANMAAAHGIIAAVGVVYFLACKNRIGILMAVVVLAASLLVGRSGLVLFVVIVVGLLPVINFRAGLAVFIILLSLTLLSILLMEITEHSRWYRWFFEDALTSLSFLYNMLSLPDGSNLLIGNGYFEDALYGMPRTDSGILKSINVLGLPIAFLFYLYLVRFFSMCIRFCVHVPGKKKAYIIFFLIIVFILLEIKEAAIYQNMTGRIFFFCVFFLLASGVYAKYSTQPTPDLKSTLTHWWAFMFAKKEME